MKEHWMALIIGVGLGAAIGYAHCTLMGGRGMGAMPKVQFP